MIQNLRAVHAVIKENAGRRDGPNDAGKGTHRAVFSFRIANTAYSVRLLVFDSSIRLADFCGYPRSAELRGIFTRGHKRAHAGHGRRLLGEIRLSKDEVDLEVIAHEVYHLIDLMRRNNFASEEDGARMCGRLTSAICIELKRIGIKLRPAASELHVQREEDKWRLLPY